MACRGAAGSAAGPRDAALDAWFGLPHSSLVRVGIDAASTRPDFDQSTGDDLLEAETIMQDVVQRRRRVFGPAHPDTLEAERGLSNVRAHSIDVDSP